MPDIDVFEREGKVIVRADLPGMKREDVQVRVEGETLVLRGHREEENEVQRRTGAFTQAVALPDGFDGDAIEATYQDGVLEATVPKPAAAEVKPVQIQVK